MIKPEALLLLTWFALVMCVAIIYYNSNWHLERAVSKRKAHARHKKATELIEDAITEAIEKIHRNGTLKDTERAWAYKRLRTVFKTIGTEPSFGKPWYYGPSIPNVQALRVRLMSKFPHIFKKETAPSESPKDFHASIRKPTA